MWGRSAFSQSSMTPKMCVWQTCVTVRLWCFLRFRCLLVVDVFFFFFFQAEDGIRDLTVTGVQTCALPISVRWVNNGEKPSSVIYFHLYPNLRTGDQPVPANGATAEADEPRIEILEVRAAVDNTALFSALDDQGTTLRVNLRESVAPGSATEVVIKFKGTVPEIDRDETSLTTHVVKQVSAALRSDREMRRARDINFLCRGVMLLGASYPVLAVHDGDDWRRKLEASVGDFVFNEAADYEVTVAAPTGVDRKSVV